MKRDSNLRDHCASAMATTAMAQPRAAVDFQLQKITTNFILLAAIHLYRREQYQADQRERWLEVEVTFSSAPEFTDELKVKYSFWLMAIC
jgi:hypothetical protein